MNLPDDANNVASSPDDELVIVSQSAILQPLRTDEPNWSADLEAKGAALNDMEVVTWDRVRDATTSDPTMVRLVEIIECGIPDSKLLLSSELREYHTIREHLSTTDGVILYKNRIVIPPALRNDVITALHVAHHGVSFMTAKSDITVCWPGITTALNQLRESCRSCNENAQVNPVPPPPITPIDPENPFQCICSDYFHYKGVN